LRSLQDLCKERITNVADQYFTNLWCVGGSQGRGEPSIEHRDRQKAKEVCVKTFVEKYDMVTTPSGEGRDVKQEMTVQVEQWWNSSDVAVSLRLDSEYVGRGWYSCCGRKTQKMHSFWRVCSTNTRGGSRRADITT
jgi:hypothetical protein